MKKLLQLTLISSLLAFTLGFGALVVQPNATPVFAATANPNRPAQGGGTGNARVKNDICDQIKRLDNKACQGTNESLLTNIVKPIIQTLILIIGGVAVLVIVVGGLMYILSAGDANNTKRAKDAILYAIIGLIVALFAQAIVTFVIGAVA